MLFMSFCHLCESDLTAKDTYSFKLVFKFCNVSNYIFLLLILYLCTL